MTNLATRALANPPILADAIDSLRSHASKMRAKVEKYEQRLRSDDLPRGALPVMAAQSAADSEALYFEMAVLALEGVREGLGECRSQASVTALSSFGSRPSTRSRRSALQSHFAGGIE